MFIQIVQCEDLTAQTGVASRWSGSEEVRKM